MSDSPIADAYRGCRERIADLVRDLDDDAASTLVPACPAWTVHDVLAHLAGAIADALEGRLDGIATDPWTAAQVEARKGVPLAEIVEEWNDKAPRIEALMDGAAAIGRQAVTDVVSHEHDIRGALGTPGARNSDAMPIALGFALPQLVESAASAGAALRVCSTDGTEYGASAADADVTLTAEPFELLRASTGRRSVEQLRRMRWTGDWKAALPGFWWLSLHPATTPIEE